MSGDLEKLLVALLNSSRDEVGEVDNARAQQQAQDLYNAGQWAGAEMDCLLVGRLWDRCRCLLAWFGVGSAELHTLLVVGIY